MGIECCTLHPLQISNSALLMVEWLATSCLGAPSFRSCYQKIVFVLVKAFYTRAISNQLLDDYFLMMVCSILFYTLYILISKRQINREKWKENKETMVGHWVKSLTVLWRVYFTYKNWVLNYFSPIEKSINVIIKQAYLPLSSVI